MTCSTVGLAEAAVSSQKKERLAVDAVRISGLSDSTLRRAIISGELKANKKGKWLIKDSWLERYLTS